MAAGKRFSAENIDIVPKTPLKPPAMSVLSPAIAKVIYPY